MDADPFDVIYRDWVLKKKQKLQGGVHKPINNYKGEISICLGLGNSKGENIRKLLYQIFYITIFSENTNIHISTEKISLCNKSFLHIIFNSDVIILQSESRGLPWRWCGGRGFNW